jgi:hypothetical protein
MEPVVIGLKNLENVLLPVPFLKTQQQYHHPQIPVPLSLLVNVSLVDAHGVHMKKNTKLRKELLQLSLLVAV